MLTRFVRNQLIIFTIASIVGVAVMIFTYMQLPALLGIGHIQVTLELPAAGGLYRFSNVTYRGVQVGEVREVKLTEKGAEAKLTLGTSPKIPADLQADVRSGGVECQSELEAVFGVFVALELETRDAVVAERRKIVGPQVGRALEAGRRRLRAPERQEREPGGIVSFRVLRRERERLVGGGKRR